MKKLLLATLALALLNSCGTPPEVKKPPTTVTLANLSGDVAKSGESVKAASGAIRREAEDVKPKAPESAARIALQCNALDGITAFIAANALALRELESDVADEYEALKLKLDDQAEVIQKLKDADEGKGKWIFRGGMGLGLLVFALCVYGVTQAPNRKTIGAAVAAFALVGLSGAFLWFGKPIAYVILGILVVAGIVLAVFVVKSLKAKTAEAKDTTVKLAESFDAAEAAVGPDKVIDALKAEWKQAQRVRNITDEVKAARGKT